MRRWLSGALALLILIWPALALASEVGEINDDDYGVSLNIGDYTALVTRAELGLQESAPVPGSYFDDAVFVGDSITLALYYYVKDLRNQGTQCLGEAKFLTAGSMGSGNALEPVGKESVHPSYQGTKMRVEDAVALMDAKKVYIMLGMNDVAYYGIDKSIENMCALIGLILERQPEAEIFVQSATPRLSIMTTKPTNRMLFEYDLKLYRACVENGWYFVDVAYAMRDGDGNLIDKYCSDPESMGMHFSEAGCAVWIEYLETHAKEGEKS